MSGIVSLLFCGITLKHYAYHTMSRRTQRATKYIFSILAQFTENFIFIYLGLSLFTSPPSDSKVTSYVKPLFIIISTVAVVFVRYASVFPLSEAINLFQRHVRGQRNDEIPYSYQMMLFWAGLRGAVGVALAAGFKGENAQTLRTTVLVVVVLTVIMFGGTTARMLEILGIRTGVDDGAISSDEEDAGAALLSNGRDWYGRRSTDTNDWNQYRDEETFGPGRAERVAAQYNHHAQHARTSSLSNTQQIFSASSSDSYDSDGGEVLPLASPTGARTGRTTPGGSRRASLAMTSPNPTGNVSSEDHKWFSALDERYLLPLFSNAPASRSFHARRQRRSAALSGGPSSSSLRVIGAHGAGEGATPAESEDEGGDVVDLRENAARNRTITASSSGSTVSANGTARSLRTDSTALRSPREPDRQPNGKFGS